MPEPGYIVAAVLISSGVTWALRAAPFAVLAPLRHSALLPYLNENMPVGIMTILVFYTVRHVPPLVNAGHPSHRRRISRHGRTAPLAAQRRHQHPRRNSRPRDAGINPACVGLVVHSPFGRHSRDGLAGAVLSPNSWPGTVGNSSINQSGMST